MKNYSKLENETELQYGWRLFSYLREGDFGWETLANYMNKECRSDESEYRTESAYRKPLQGAEKYYNEVFSKLDCSNSDNIDNKLRDLEAERIKLQTVKSEYRNMIRKDARQELFYENIGKVINTFPIPFYVNDYINKESKKAYVLTLADIHCGAEFEIEKNKYNYDECAKRFGILEKEMIDYIIKNEVSNLSVVNLADNVQGILRLSDLKLNQTSVVEATVIVSKLIAQFLNNLSVYCYIDYYAVPTSNHTQTRNLGSDRNGLKDEDVEYIIANYIKDSLKDNIRINCHTNFGYDYIEFSILNQNAIAMHGHTVNIGTALKDISFHNRRFYDYLFIAHLHAGKESVDGATADRDIETLLCPSFIGTCPYSDGLMKASQPSCKVFVFDEKNGHTDTHKIILK